ncbi:MAG: hypothetical protein GYA21_08415 [Myxococcales bacterium]|nr:hypothetical protein [Myxococcales bacterium]
MSRARSGKSGQPSGRFEVLVDEKLYPREVSLAAAYRFLDRFYVRAERVPPERLRFTFKPRPSATEMAPDGIEDSFHDELLQQLMRHQVAEATAGIREVLVRTALQAAEGNPTALDGNAGGSDTAGYLDDPLGIAVPWEEKYGTAQAECGCEDSVPEPTKKKRRQGERKK